MRTTLFALAFLLPAVAQAEDAAIRISGPAAMRGMVERWAEAYSRSHPESRFELTMKGSDTAIPGLYGGQADIALMGRENDIVDDNGFSRTMQFAATRIQIANGSVARPGKSDAIALLVASDNPLSGLTSTQLARILDCGGATPIRVWGELGLGGAWASATIRIDSYDFASRTGAWLQDRITAKSRKMCWDRIVEHDDVRRLDGTVEPAAEAIGRSARGIRNVLAIANAGEAHDGLKLIALDGVMPDREAIVAGRYPLARRAYAFVARPPGTPLDARIARFLEFVLSADGQAMLSDERDYLPLDTATADKQRAILGQRK